MCQIPRQYRTTKYRNVWSYKWWKNQKNVPEKTGCEKTLEFAKHKGPIIFEQCLETLNEKPHLWHQTEGYPDFISWRISKNLPIYNETSFY